MLPSTTRRLSAVLAIVAFVGVLIGTLTPSSASPSSFDFWCIACGELAALDVVANMVLFMPLGFALAVTMNRRSLPLAICVATTVMVEALQVGIIVGRDASFRDLLANSVGGIIGVELALRRRGLLWPTPAAATRLALAGSVAFAGVCAATAWGVRPAFVPRSLWMQWLPPRSGYESFTGRLLAFDIDGIDLPVYPSPSLGLDKRLMADSWRATATIDRDGLTPRRSVIVRVSEEFTQPFALEQRNWDLTCLQKTRSAELRFRSPRIALRDAFRLSSGTHPDIVRLRCIRRHGALLASVEAGAESREKVVPLSPSLGWTLLSPFDIPIGSRTWWIGALWLMALVFPIGYWWSSATHRTSRSSSGLQSSMVIGAGMLAGATSGFVIAPLAAGTTTGTWWDWCAVVTGIACGASFRHLLLAMSAFRLRM